MVPERRSLVVHDNARALRRRLGALAWAVLEELLAQSSGPTTSCVAAATVRSLAGELGVSKDAVARALRRLREAGIVTVAQSRALSGTFTAGCYLIDVPTCVTFVEPSAPSAVKPRPRPLASRAAIAQHSLFDADPGTP